MEKMNKMCQEALNMIIYKGKREDMDELGYMLCDMMDYLKYHDENMYNKMASKMHEMAYGHILTEEMAQEWVKSMPYGEHWSMKQTTDAMKQLGWSYDEIPFYVYANKMYNWHYETVKSNDKLALNLAKDKMEYLRKHPHCLYKAYKEHYLGIK